jgi:hypothetical protein
MNTFVYCWTNHANGMLYIGVHTGDENDGYISSSKYLNEAYCNDKINFTRQILARGNRSDMVALETAILQSANASKNKDFYNKHNNNGQYKSHKHSEITKKKMSIAHTGKIRSHAFCEMRKAFMRSDKNPWIGRAHTEESKAKMSVTKSKLYTGAGNPRAKRVTIHGITYDTIKDAAKQNGVTVYHIRKIIESEGI